MLGLTLYELFARQPAFEALDRNALIRAVTDSEPRRLRRLDPSIPRDLETVIHKAIEKSPEDRYSSADELARDLRRYLDDRPVTARRVRPLERFARWCRRRPLIAGLTLTLASTLFVGLIVTTSLWLRSERERLRADRNLSQARDAVDECFSSVHENQLLRQSGL